MSDRVSVDLAVSVDPPRPPTAREASGRRQRGVRRWWRRRPIRKTLVVTHRWTSFVLGLILLLVTTSGAVALYAPEWNRWTNADVFTVTASGHPVGVTQAMAIVAAAHPDFEVGGVNVDDSGLIEVTSSNEEHTYLYGVDPGTGRITGKFDPDHGFMGFVLNLHECFLSCDSYTGYVAFLNKDIPTLGLTLLNDITWGSLLLGVMGVLLLFLAISGLILWWPGIKRWANGFWVRWRKGRYARDYDLHQVIGMAAVPFLLMWGLTGASFEFDVVNKVWYALTDGVQPAADQYDFASAKVTGTKPDIGLDAAIAAARSKVGGTIAYASLPAADDETAAYSLYFSVGNDPYKYGPYPGQVGVSVDRHNAAHLKVTSAAHGETLSNTIWDVWRSPVFHYGFAVNGWWRIIWFLMGLTPLLLAVTGISTALAKRAVRKRKKAAKLAAAADVPAAVTADVTADDEPATQGSA